MARSLIKSVVCPVLIGRASSLHTLHQSIAQTKSKLGQTLLVSGEAGVGKSRLATEAKVAAHEEGFRVLQGNCFQPDVAYPYAPLLDLLRPTFSSIDLTENTSRWVSTAQELSRLLPELAPGTPLEALPVLDADQHKRRLFAVLRHVFSSWAAAQALLVIIEDIHWSDETSLEFLHLLARLSKTHAIFLLATYRTDETHPPLRRWLAQLDREHLAQELSLSRLTRPEVDEMLQAIFDLRRPIRAAFLDTIYSLTEGNPFFIEELLKSLIAAGKMSQMRNSWDHQALDALHIPRSIQDAVQQRFERLSDLAKQTIVIAAVVGRRFDFTLLQALTRHTEQELLHSIKELIGAQLVVEESADQFSFRHALTRQAIYAELLIRERTALHQQIGETLEHLHTDTIDAYAAELAYHYYEASDWEKALIYCTRAGERASRLYALQSAIDHFTHALEAAYHLKTVLPPSLYRTRARVYQIRGEFERSRADLESAIRIAKTNQEPREEWQCLLDLGQLWMERDYPRARDYLQSALALAERIKDPELIARTLNPIGNWHVNTAHPQDAIVYHEQALALFKQLDSKPGVAETLSLLGFSYAFVGDTWRGKALRDRAIDLFRELDDRPRLVDAYCSRAACCPARLTTDTFVPANVTLTDAIQQLDTARHMAREIDSPNAEAWALHFLCACIMSQGKFTQAIAVAMQGLAMVEETGHRELMCAFHSALGALYLDLFALQQAQQHLELAGRLAQQIGHRYFVMDVGGWFALLHIQQGGLDQAQAALDAVSDANTPQLTLAQRRCWYSRAILALAQDDTQTALQLLDELIASAPNSGNEQVIPQLAIARGEALMTLGQFGEAESTLRTAQTMLEEWGVYSLEWRASILLSKVQHLRGRHNEADEVHERAKAIIDMLAANIEGDELRALFLEGTALQLPAARPISPRQAAKRAFGGLTAREREIAGLVARGLTNRQIATHLVISEETVNAHVKHILSKLHFTSRAQIAAWIVQKDPQALPSDNNRV